MRSGDSSEAAKGLEALQRNVRITALARELFGEFVPEISYPSVLEIETELRARVESTEYAVAKVGEAGFDLIKVFGFHDCVMRSGGKAVNYSPRNDQPQPHGPHAGYCMARHLPAAYAHG